jgi:hypothetical protein
MGVSVQMAAISGLVETYTKAISRSLSKEGGTPDLDRDMAVLLRDVDVDGTELTVMEGNQVAMLADIAYKEPPIPTEFIQIFAQQVLRGLGVTERRATELVMSIAFHRFLSLSQGTAARRN